MREFDLRNSWLDDNGNPLVGRVKFCKLHTTELENIYDITGEVVLSNPMLTNNLGQLDVQVFLSDKDYTVRFEQYIGHGRMEDDDNPSNWLFAYSADSLYDTFNISVESEGLQSVDSIDDLRTLDPSTVQERTGVRIIELQGYNVAGDKPIVRYVWNEYSTDNDNGGNIIKVDNIGTGRWELVNDFNEVTGVDIRHFGVFGKDSINDIEQTMPAKIDAANTYAMSIGYPLYFNSNDGDLTWFKINSNLNGAIFAKGTRIVASSNCFIRVYNENSNLDVYNDANNTSVVTILGEVVRTSWGINSNKVIFNPGKKLVIDSQITTSNKDWEDIEVDCLTNVSGCQFTNCDIHSIGKLAVNNIFHNCILKEYMFANGFTATVYDDDIIELKDWTDVSKWLYLVTQTSIKPLDFEGRTVDSNCDVSWSTCVYKNAVFDNFEIKQTNVSFENCSGYVYGSNSITALHTKDCDMTLDCTIDTYTSIDSTITMNGTKSFNGFNVTNTNVTGGTYTITNCAATDSTLNVSINADVLNLQGCTVYDINCKAPVLIDCEIYGTITQIAPTNVIDFVIKNCKFYDGQGHNISGTVADSIVVGSWIGNYSELSQHFIMIDRTNIDLVESHHSYKYENNVGEYVLQRDKAVAYKTINYTSDYGINARTVDDDLVFSYSSTPTTDDSTTNQYSLVDFAIFSVGTEGLPEMTMTVIPTSDMLLAGQNPSKFRLKWILNKVILGNNERTRTEWQSQGQTGYFFRKGFMFKNGYTFGVTCADDFARTSTWMGVAGGAIAAQNTTKFIIEKV